MGHAAQDFRRKERMTATKESHILKYEQARAEAFRPNQNLNDLLARLMPMLTPVQLQQNAAYVAPRFPVAVIIGCPRSGTTVLTQILAATGDFAYPTNFLSRFAYAPVIGAMIQEMLFNPAYDFRGELADIQSSSNFHSSIGKTSGALGISEFFHFWRKFFPNHDPGHLTDEELAQVDVARMRSELASMESVFNKPFMSKGMMMQFNVRYFAEHVPELFFIHISREPTYLLQSVYLARKQFYGETNVWWSVKPKEYEWLADEDFIHQVAGQVFFTEKAIEEQLAHVPDDRQLVYRYEALCADPQRFYEQLSFQFEQRGYRLNPYRLETSFASNNALKLPREEIDKLEKAYATMESRYTQAEQQKS
jgi:hypothetical protein